MISFVVAISGASGSLYGIRLVEELSRTVDRVYLCVSHHAFPIIRIETGIDWDGESEMERREKVQAHFGSDRVQLYNENDLSAPFSSGSFITGGMFIVPCSMKTLSAIASGYADNLIARAADVTLKEGRRLILSPREMPFNSIHLENMLKLSRMGVTIAPPVPAFYNKPGSIDDMVDFVVGRLLDSSGTGHNLFKRWE